MEFLLEIVATDAAEIRAATEGGADRLEICTAIELGGLTPSPGLVDEATQSLPSVVMLRPHARSFVYSEYDRRIISRDLRWIAESKAEGVVFGALTREGNVDLPLLREVIDAGKPVVFHRAFDLIIDVDKALDDLLSSGVIRILTSGGASTALLGLDRLRRMAQRAGPRVEILPGGGIRPDNVLKVSRAVGTGAVHAAPFRSAIPEPSVIRRFREGEDNRGF